MIGWLDASAGASGDMLLGALVDAGVPLQVLQSTLDSLGPLGIILEVHPVTRHGLAASLVRVHVPDDPQPHRGLPAIRTLLASAPLQQPVRDLAIATFERLAAAEATVHRTEMERVHFHEVGALDAIADVVAGCAGVAHLRAEHGLTSLSVGPIEAGSAAPPVPAAHGAVPVPAPAVVEIARRAGLLLTGALPHEACTPTGAALLATLTSGQGPMPAIVPEIVGIGAGGRDPDQAPNVLRLLLGSAASAAGTTSTGTTGTGRISTRTAGEVIASAGTLGGAGVDAEPAVLVECNVDDLDPRLWPAALAALLDAGASDAWLSPILMKKGRPAHTLHVLCPPETVAAVRAAVFAHTTTIGLRESTLVKRPLQRSTQSVDVYGHPVAVKVARLDGRIINASAEFEDVRRAARLLDRPTKVVLAAANAAAQALLDTDRVAGDASGLPVGTGDASSPAG